MASAFGSLNTRRPSPDTVAASPGSQTNSRLGVGLSSAASDSPYLSLPMGNFADPRSSSTHSLLPATSSGPTGASRTLLVIYIHGFMGNDSSFRSFPAHVHNHLKEALAETHVIHTKIYPRYKTYKSIDVACENFSRWLAPHESDTTDVILIGHSMGGLLAADVVLLPNYDTSRNPSPFRHRILGTISLDAPLLGLHPGIVISGIASLFRPAPSQELPGVQAGHSECDSTPSASLTPDASVYEQVRPPSGAPSPTLSPPAPDPTYNPTFFNDVAFVDRGWLKNIVHFANKHRQENLVEAAANHILSHLEFGSCLADYPGLKSRYNKLRFLEDVDELTQRNSGQNLVRVRFVNYYTVSTGLPKKPKPEKKSLEVEEPRSHARPSNTSDPSTSGIASPRISVEDCSSQTSHHSSSEDDTNKPLQILDPIPISEDPLAPSPTPDLTDQPHSVPPDLPSPPTPPDLSSIQDKESRKAAERSYKAALKEHEQSVKAREKLIKSQQKAQEKAQREKEKAQERSRKESDKQQREFQKAKRKSEEKIQKEEKKLQKEKEEAEEEEEKKKKKEEGKKKRLGKFCMLPFSGGEQDEAWVQVYMQDMDEVGAHCGLFIADRPGYEQFVGDVGERITRWVQEDGSRRLLMEEMSRV